MEDIFLIGPKHSGKTSVGKILSSLCSCEFIDLDELITQRTGKSPRELYKESPDVFKKVEAEAAAALINKDDSGLNNTSINKTGRFRVIAAGGGLIDNIEALALLNETGAVKIYLDVSADSAWERINNSGNVELPPFLQTDNPRETHRVLHERRVAGYRQIADIIIKADGKTPEEIAAGIITIKSL
ncbi:MAG: shikimate kinase [Treponema sp.]|nr:shikimate kinase [Treponema sp.]